MQVNLEELEERLRRVEKRLDKFVIEQHSNTTHSSPPTWEEKSVILKQLKKELEEFRRGN